MGKSPEKLRLTILVDKGWLDHPKVLELIEKGHHVGPIVLDDAAGPHLILSRHAWQWADDMWHLLPITLKAARERKKGDKSESD